MKTKCEHGTILPKGLKCDRGYLIIRIHTEKGPYNRGCGPHTKAMEGVAKEKLMEIRLQQQRGTFGLPERTIRLKFDEAATLFQQKHFLEYKDPQTQEPRKSNAISTNGYRLKMLAEYFGEFYFDAITLKDIKSYREKRMEFDDVKAGTLNRDMSVLSSMFTQFERWNMEDDKAKQIKLPAKNPCKFLEDLREIPRTRVASMEELKRLKKACQELNDLSMWSIIETEIHTSLRLNDLMRLEDVEIKDGQFTLAQGKTGTDISFPASAKPNWSKVFSNFRARWEIVRARAFCGDLQFRDLRKTGLQLLEKSFTPDQLASKAGHSDSKVTKKWYLSNKNTEQMASMIEATKKLLGEL